jgi:hypothetical protein
MKPTKEQIRKVMDEIKEIGGISLEIIYSSEKINDKAKMINKKAYEAWTKLAKMSDHPQD